MSEKAAAKAPQSAGRNAAPAPAHAAPETQPVERALGNRDIGRLHNSLQLSQPGDADELEADRVARQVMAQGFDGQVARRPVQLQRKCQSCEEEESSVRRKANQGAAPMQVNSSTVITEGGRPLAAPVRDFFEPRFGHSFEHVRVHDDAAAHRSARAIGAKAYTVGNHISFVGGQYNPGTLAGRELLAHELTHVLQQRNGLVQPKIRRQDDEQIARLARELIPTAAMSIDLNGVLFLPTQEAVFQEGSKTFQLLRIALRVLWPENQYSEALVKELTELLETEKDQYKRYGHFDEARDAYTGEKILNFRFETQPFLRIVRFLKSKKLDVQLDEAQWTQLRNAYSYNFLWDSIVRIAGEEGMPLPAWYDEQMFNRHVAARMGSLERFRDFLLVYEDTGAGAARQGALRVAAELFYEIYGDIAFLEAIRLDVALYINPLTQTAYQAIWYLTDKYREKVKPALYLGSIDNAFALLEFTAGHESLKINSEVYHESRVELLRKFLGEGALPDKQVKLLPPYPAFIASPDLNADNTTIPSATNTFRMITNTYAVHGGTQLHQVGVAMARDIYYSWSVVPLPDSLKFMRNKTNIKPEDLVKEADEFVKNSPQTLQTPLKRYGPSRDDYEQEVKMKGLGIGEYLLAGHAAPHYRSDLRWVQEPSTAGYPFFVHDATQLANSSAYADWDMLSSLQEQQLKTENTEEKQAYQEEIDRLQGRESSGLRELTQKDMADTGKLIESARKLRLFIEDDRKSKLPAEGNATADPFIIRLKRFDPALYEVYRLIREMYSPWIYDDIRAVDEYIKILEAQRKELEKLGVRVADAHGRFKPGAPVYRVVAALVKEDDGNVVPLMLLAGHHPDSDPLFAPKIMLVDVTFDAPKKGDMIYVGDMGNDMAGAVQSAFVEFGEDNKYGEGKIVYRLPNTPYKGTANSVTTFFEYLEYALAALGIIMLVAGTIASAGALSPAAVAVITVLGVSLAVVGAAMAVRNMEKRREKGVLEMDAETALDIISIIGAAVMVVGTVSKVSMMARGATLMRMLTIQRLERLIAVYDFTELGANIYLLNVKVQDDIRAIKALGLPPQQEEEMIAAVTFDAIQQGAMMGVSAYSTLRQIPDVYQKQVETSRYQSWLDKGWVREDAKGRLEITDFAPPFLRELKSKVGTAPPADQQGDSARKAVTVEPMVQAPTRDGLHQLTLTERGRIIRCSDLCQDLRVRYEKLLAQDPDLEMRLKAIEKKASDAANNRDKTAAKEALDEATELEATLRWSERQWDKFTGVKDPADADPAATPDGKAVDEPVTEVPMASVAPVTQPRINIIDLVTQPEAAGQGSGVQRALMRLGNLLGKTVADVPLLKQHWDAAVAAVLKGKAIGDLTPADREKLRSQVSRKFWQLAARDPNAVAFLQQNGFTIGKKGAAPLAELGPVGKGKTKGRGAIRDQDRQVSLESRGQDADPQRMLDADQVEFMFRGAGAQHAKKPRKTSAAKDALVLTPEERRLATHGKSLGMLDTELARFIEQFRASKMPVDDMLRQMNQWAETLKRNPKARARIAPDFILDPDSRARLPDFERQIAGTGGIEKITARDSAPEEGGGLAVTIEGVVMPGRLSRSKKGVTAKRRRAPDFNRSDKLFSNKEAGLSRLWQRLHLWGPGFGDEAAAGMMWGPRDVNLVWQNQSIETRIRDLASLTERYGGRTRVKATAIAWENPTPGGFRAPQGENFLKRVEYEITLQRPGRPDTTIRVTLDISEPPNGGIKSFDIDPPHAVNPGDLFP
jgi:hypothetical protein